MLNDNQYQPDSPPLYRNGLYWFTNDLRIEDNPALEIASRKTEKLLCIYIVNPAWFLPNRYGLKSIDQHRWQFLQESLTALSQALRKLGQQLLITYELPIDTLARLITQFNIEALFRSQNAGHYENYYWNYLKRRYSLLHFEETASHTLFSQNELPFTLDQIPETFSKFRQSIEALHHNFNITTIDSLTPPQSGLRWSPPVLPSVETQPKTPLFKGGCKEAKRHLLGYFSSRLPSHYKQVRNALDGWENSSKFSPWLANGSLSVKQVWRSVLHYEKTVEANESTYWLRFELLWREYFQWFAHAHKTKLFRLKGIKQHAVLNSFYPERFQRWCQGATPYPLVNACMKQLNATGYMSNRGRQIVASCFVNELKLDWRYGAAYFEQQLIDYDVAINWGNWQYLAGVGADSRGKRHFDIDKQTRLYDPKKSFIQQWQGEDDCHQLDSVDAADWPIVENKNER